MPFPWKKVKNTRISQLVSDHIDSQRRRGGHLVVETGFPTSLVDLFVKNSERLKKPKPPKTKKTKNHDNSLISKPPSPSTSISLASSPSRSPVPPSPRPPLIAPQFDNGVREADEVQRGPNEGANSKGLVVAVLRIFFVVVLALGTKKFALGLTMSAFVLFSVEYVGKHLYRLLIPCSDAKKKIRMMIVRVLRIVGIREDRLEEGNSSFKGKREPIEHQCSQLNNHGFGSPIREIQIAQPMGCLFPKEEGIGKSTSDRKEEIRIKEDVNKPCVRKLEPQGSNSKTVIMEDEVEYSCERKKCKRAKLKLKMKHLFPRKRSSKKVKNGEPDLGGEMSSNKAEPVSVCEGREEDEHRDGTELECASNLSSLSSGRYDGNDVIRMVSSSGTVLAEDVEGIVEEEENRKVGKSGYLILCLIVLIGLFGGRIFALLLILLWCLMLKSDGKIRRYMKLPAISSFDETSS